MNEEKKRQIVDFILIDNRSNSITETPTENIRFRSNVLSLGVDFYRRNIIDYSYNISKIYFNK